MADDNLRDEIAQMDQTLFGENPVAVETVQATPQAAPQAAPQAEGGNPSLNDLFVAAGLEAPAPQEPAVQDPQTQVPAVQEPEAQEDGLAGGEEPSQQDIMHAYMQQQAQLNEQLATQQQQYQQQQHQQQYQQQQPAQPNMNDPRELAEMMTTVGLDPTSATDVFMFRSEMTNRQHQSRYEGQISEMQNYINLMHSQQQQQKNESSLAPQVDATLNMYGSIPPEVAGNIKAQAATILSENLGNATEAQAIQWAVKPYLPLLKMIQQGAPAQTAAPAQQQSAAKPNANAQAVLAAALSGGSSGHRPTLEDVDITQLEKALFRSN